jgi:oligopeptide/dipeptide ABC transporter ATP-binding protein
MPLPFGVDATVIDVKAEQRKTGIIGAAESAMPLLRVRNLVKHFDVSGGAVRRLLYGSRTVKAVDGVSFDVAKGETIGLVGESGSGKSTTARVIARLLPVNSGEVLLSGYDVLKASTSEMKALRKDIQFVFQDPFSSLNPRMRTEMIIGRALTIHFGLRGEARRKRVVHLLEQVGLSSQHLERYPHEFSGGQRQRIAIARALATEPSLILADEPVSSLDVSIQAQVLALLHDLRTKLQLTMVFITHDLNVAEFVSDRIAVMYGGKIMEEGSADIVMQRPLHPYTQALLDTRPRFGHAGQLRPLEGEPAVPLNPGPGCRFASRCPRRVAACTEQSIPLVSKGNGHSVACIRA